LNLRDADAEFVHVRCWLKCKRNTERDERLAGVVIAHFLEQITRHGAEKRE
jgi:hypothetical protein